MSESASPPQYTPLDNLLEERALLKDWTLTLTGVYSERLDGILDELIQLGSIKVCKDGG